MTHVVDGIGGLVSRDLPKTEAHEGHVVTGGQFDARDRHNGNVNYWVLPGDVSGIELSLR